MTISSTNSRMTYTGNGSVSSYSFTYKIFDEGDLLVTVKDTDGVETTLTITTDYTVTMNANGTGSIQLVSSGQDWLTGGNLTTGYRLVIRRVVEVVQETDIRNQGEFFPEVHEDAFDYQTMIQQQQQDEIDRSIKVAETDDPLTFNLPTQEERASQFLAFDADGEPIAASAVSGVAVSSYMQTVLDDTTAAAARTTLGFTGALATTGSVDTTAIDADAVTNAKLANMTALSVKGNGTNASENPTDLAAANDYEVIQRVGTSVAFGPYKRKYRNATTTDSIATTDDLVVFSGASFTATLPTAVGNTGKVFTLQHGGTSLTQVYTLNTTSAQTIGGIASGSYALYTSGETLVLISDGSNWLILDHKTATDWSSSSTITITATTTNPTKATGVTDDEIYWRREGMFAHIKARYRQSNNTSANNGSGDYLFALPTNLTMDTTEIGVYTTVEGWNSYFDLDAHDVGRFCYGATDTYGLGLVVPYDTTKVRAFPMNLSQAGCFGSGITFFTTPSVPVWFTLDIKVPISGWQP